MLSINKCIRSLENIFGGDGSDNATDWAPGCAPLVASCFRQFFSCCGRRFASTLILGASERCHCSIVMFLGAPRRRIVFKQFEQFLQHHARGPAACSQCRRYLNRRWWARYQI